MADIEAFVDQADASEQVKSAQPEQAKAPRATVASFLGKKERRSEFTFTLDPDVGPETILLVALSRPEYDKLSADHPPTPKQQRAGMDVNQDTFTAALLSKVVREPALTLEQWLEVYNSPAWSLGEIGSLFYEANALCQERIDLVPFVSG